MARISNKETKTPQEIAEYRNDVVDSLAQSLNLAFDQQAARFNGMNRAAFEKFLSGRIAETDLCNSLSLLASIEAAFHVDLAIRGENRRYRDDLSKQLRILHKRWKRQHIRIKFDKELLALWVVYYPISAPMIGQLRAKLKLRNWLAHGRCLTRPTHGNLDWDSIYALAEDLIGELHLLS